MGRGLQSIRSKRANLVWPAALGNLPIAVLLSIPFVLMILITKLDFRLIGDEGVFHIKIIESFADQWPLVDLSDYRSASTPLSYLAMTAYGKAFGFEISKLRMLSAIATFLAAYIFYGIAKRRNLPHPLASSFIFLFFPYVFFYGFTIYPAAIGLFFGMWALSYYLLDDPTTGQLIKGSTLASFAILCRQSFVVIPAGVLLYEIWQMARLGFINATRASLQRLAILSAPILVLLTIFAIWGGFTTPSTQASGGGAWFLQFKPQHLNYILLMVGFYFFPVLFSQGLAGSQKSKMAILAAVAVMLLVLLAFPVVYDNEPRNVQQVAGFVIRGLDVLRRSSTSLIGHLATLSLWSAGLLILIGEWLRTTEESGRGRLVAIALMFVLLMMISPFIYERYYVLLFPLLILTLHRSFKSKWLLSLWVAVQTSIVVGFSYWQIAIK